MGRTPKNGVGERLERFLRAFVRRPSGERPVWGRELGVLTAFDAVRAFPPARERGRLVCRVGVPVAAWRELRGLLAYLEEQTGRPRAALVASMSLGDVRAHVKALKLLHMHVWLTVKPGDWESGKLFGFEEWRFDPYYPRS